MASAQILVGLYSSWPFFDNFLISLLLTAPSYVDLSPGPFEDTQFDAVIDVETSDDCMDDEGITDISVKMAVSFTEKSVSTIVYPFQIYYCYIIVKMKREWRCFVINPIDIQYSVGGTVEWLLCSVDILNHWFKIKAMAD